jgi:hypothetical protein
MRRPFFLRSMAANANAGELESRQPLQPAYNTLAMLPVTTSLETPAVILHRGFANAPFLTAKAQF